MAPMYTKNISGRSPVSSLWTTPVCPKYQTHTSASQTSFDYIQVQTLQPRIVDSFLDDLVIGQYS